MKISREKTEIDEINFRYKVKNKVKCFRVKVVWPKTVTNLMAK